MPVGRDGFGQRRNHSFHFSRPSASLTVKNANSTKWQSHFVDTLRSVLARLFPSCAIDPITVVVFAAALPRINSRQGITHSARRIASCILRPKPAWNQELISCSCPAPSANTPPTAEPWHKPGDEQDHLPPLPEAEPSKPFVTHCLRTFSAPQSVWFPASNPGESALSIDRR